MTRETYIRLMDWWRAHPALLRALTLANQGITGAIYVAYPLLLAYLALAAPVAVTLRATIVPLVGLVGVTLLRNAINAPRPYQVFQAESAIPKDALGNSMPSKHTFCIFIIAVAFLASLPTPLPGALVMALGVALGAIRVLSGVHFPRDVLMGAGLALLLGLIGFYWI